MPPGVAEIVLVGESIAFSQTELPQFRLTFVYQIEFAEFVGFRIAVPFSENFKLMEVIVLPSEGSLDQLVQCKKMNTVRNQNSSPDRWLCFGQIDSDLPCLA